MSVFYRILYQVGFTPWEKFPTQFATAEQIAAMFDREQDGRHRPCGRVLDLGCGSGIHAVALAVRGWDVTGVDAVPKALHRARERARKAGVDVRFLHGDITTLRAAGVETGFQLVLDLGTVHGLTDPQREAVAREVNAVTAPDATLLMLAFAPGRRGPIPRGMSRADIEALYTGWSITDVAPLNSKLPLFLKKLNADPHLYRLRRQPASSRVSQRRREE